MKKNKLKIVALVLAFLGVQVFSGAAVFAEEAGNSSMMTISPMYQRMILMPGEKAQGSIKISNPNTSTTDLVYGVFVGSFSQRKDGDSKDDYGVVDIQAESEYNQIMNWITLEKTAGTVAPNNTDILNFTINVPNDAPAGGQYATIVVRDDTERENAQGGNVSIQSTSQVASIIYAEVTGETRKTGEIKSNSVPSLLFSSPLEVSSVVRNSGNVHTDAEYTLQVWSIFSDEEICTNEENPTKNLVLPDTEKYYVQTCDLPMIGIFRAKQTVKIFGETSIVEKTIFVCPLWLICIIIFAIIAIVVWLVTRSRARKKRK